MSANGEENNLIHPWMMRMPTLSLEVEIYLLNLLMIAFKKNILI